VVVPKLRALVKQYKMLQLPEIEALLSDEYHECRMTALLFLAENFKAAKRNLRFLY
jgi:hypothetical protein